MESNISRQITKSHNLLIGIDKQGWAIPYQIKLQTCMIGLSDYGVTAQVKQIQDSFLYLSVDLGKNFNIITCSQILFNTLFKENHNRHSLDQIRLDLYMPTLASFTKKNRYENSFYETIFVKPKNKSQVQFDNLKQSPEFIELLLQMDIFKISAQCTFIENKFTQILQLKINEVDLIEENDHKIEFLKQSMDHLEQYQIISQEFTRQQKQILDQKSKFFAKQKQNSLTQNEINEDSRNFISEKNNSELNKNNSKYISNENIIQNSRQTIQQLDFTSKSQQNSIFETTQLKEYSQQFSYYKVQEENQAQSNTHLQIQAEIISQPEFLFSSINILSNNRDSPKMIQYQQNLVSPNIITRNSILDQNYQLNSIEKFDQFALDNQLNPKNINNFQRNLNFDQLIQKSNKIVSKPCRMSYLTQQNMIKSFKEKEKSSESNFQMKSFLKKKTLRDKTKQFTNKKIGSLQKLQGTSIQSYKSEYSYKKSMINMIKRPSKLIGLQLIKYSEQINSIAEYVITIANQRVLMVIVENGAKNLYLSYQKQQLDQYQQLKQKLDSLYNIIDNQQNNEYFNSLFENNFIEKVLQKNSCLTINENQQYLTVKGFNVTECDSQDDSFFFFNMNKVFSELSLSDQFYFQKYYDYIISVLTEFAMKNSYDNYTRGDSQMTKGLSVLKYIQGTEIVRILKWYYVYFSDEFMFNTETNGNKFAWEKTKSELDKIMVPIKTRFPNFRIHLWALISYEGAEAIRLLEGSVNPDVAIDLYSRQLDKRRQNLIV
ncbi:hypothetical protein TTHERM_00066730 (macronuclear) [Tetrahymena thermophila SB210]|uniref:Uncharacterized protein n=1 Tax=Tetrahymena thermophila (strain SB210) TaxID=312017 RepID=I7M6X9_TETTS|nr:hypothetical protein TTHERM_00066730 [Tetrahymena thermophila SB210]EAR87467.2 hypothetical protein TTHERM_00066730 [Tetrahymena thermophila SB210]|eukprot:XP_001007712.2 hypothetical protein TTHERM_00066730 [Tetrahymena thermophila SB210]